MLTNFFRLNGDPQDVSSGAELTELLRSGGSVENIAYKHPLYQPEGKLRKIEDKLFKNVSFKDTRLIGVNFSNCRFVDCLFLGTKFEDCEFHTCTFEGCNLYDVTFSHTYIDPKVFESLLPKKGFENIGLRLFQALRENAFNTHQGEFAATADFNFRLWKRRQLSYELRKEKINRLIYLKRWAPNFLYQWLAGYGVRSRYLATWFGIFILGIWSLNYAVWSKMGMHGAAGPVMNPSGVQAAYFSIVTVSTVGYGDLTPTTPFGMKLVMVEAALGIVFLSLFASIIIKRVAR